jgi:hypothetical protein
LFFMPNVLSVVVVFFFFGWSPFFGGISRFEKKRI